MARETRSPLTNSIRASYQRPKSTAYQSSSSPDALGSFLAQVSRHKLLTAEEEIQLGTSMRAAMSLLEAYPHIGLTLTDKALVTDLQAEITNKSKEELQSIINKAYLARKKLIECNLRFVVTIAKRFYSSAAKIDLIDLVQEGTIGLNRAAEKFDPHYEVRFTTYAGWWIRQAVTRAISQQTKSIRVPVGIYEKINRLHTFALQYERLHNRPPTIKEMASKLGVSQERVKQLQEWSVVTCSLDAKINSDSRTEWAECLLIDKNPASEIYTVILCEQAITTLRERERQVLIWKFGLGGTVIHTNNEIAAKLNLSGERIRQIINEAKKKIRLKVVTDWKLNSNELF